jgi:site-specific DNA-methyltransferase (adenine-specific)
MGRHRVSGIIIPFEPMWEQLKRVIKKNGAIVLFGGQPFTSALIMSNIKMFKYCWYWRKERGTNFATAKYMPMKVVEECIVFAMTRLFYNPILRTVKPYKHATTTKVLGVHNTCPAKA